MLRVPDVKNYKGFLQWIKDLPQIESPTWSGLPLNVEKIVRERQAASLLSNLMVIQGTSDEALGSGSEKDSGKAAWLINLQGTIEKMLTTLPS
mmetsp:Transcript_22406/g.16888  ORF Transcript_22406/g.16888 Transcript_22406/m.16888 type:complete len:93 (+) Transcript_22406:1268-1546(+)